MCKHNDLDYFVSTKDHKDNPKKEREKKLNSMERKKRGRTVLTAFERLPHDPASLIFGFGTPQSVRTVLPVSTSMREKTELSAPCSVLSNNFQWCFEPGVRSLFENKRKGCLAQCDKKLFRSDITPSARIENKWETEIKQGRMPEVFYQDKLLTSPSKEPWKDADFPTTWERTNDIVPDLRSLLIEMKNTQHALGPPRPIFMYSPETLNVDLFHQIVTPLSLSTLKSLARLHARMRGVVGERKVARIAKEQKAPAEIVALATKALQTAKVNKNFKQWVVAMTGYPILRLPAYPTGEWMGHTHPVMW